MTLTALRDDALLCAPDHIELRLSLPWIRSLPLSSLIDPRVTIDGLAHPAEIALGDRRVAPADLIAEDAWWFVQDRVVLHVPDAVAPGTHEIAVSFGLEIPYLPGGPDVPLRLPFRFARELSNQMPQQREARDVGVTA